MSKHAIVRSLFPSQLAALVLASAIGIPAWAQQSQPTADTPERCPCTRSECNCIGLADSNTPRQRPMFAPAKEGFWGHVNPFARKVWVRKQTDPINNRLTELDQVNAKNAADIKDVDSRAQAGIFKAQAAADAANQTATAAGAQAQNANGIAQTASGHVDQLNTTVNGLDQVPPGYRRRCHLPWRQPGTVCRRQEAA